MLGLCAVAGFTGNDDMLAQFLLIDHVGMAAFANLVPGMSDGPRCNFSNGRSAVVAVLPETLRHHRGSQNQENAD